MDPWLKINCKQTPIHLQSAINILQKDVAKLSLQFYCHSFLQSSNASLFEQTCFFTIEAKFLLASTRLYKYLGWSIRSSVRPPVTQWTFLPKIYKNASLPLPTHGRLMLSGSWCIRPCFEEVQFRKLKLSEEKNVNEIEFP